MVGRFWRWRYWNMHGKHGHYSLRTHRRTLETQCKGDGFMGDRKWHKLDYSRSWEREEIEAAIAANGKLCDGESASHSQQRMVSGSQTNNAAKGK
jgi:hypothetical protein